MNNESTRTPAEAPQPSGATGPRTTAGKAISSQNARKHDLCSRTLRLSPEEWVEYNDMCDRFRRDLRPAGDLEQTLIDEICFNYWRLQQAREVELQIILGHPTELPIIALYIRYRTGYERAFYKALDKVQGAQRVRNQNANGGPVRSANAKAAPAAPVRSADPAGEDEIAEIALHLEDQLEAHLLENKMRAMQQLSPLEMPKKLVARLDHFVSQNPDALPEHLVRLSTKGGLRLNGNTN